jgi:hypothetical protein
MARLGVSADLTAADTLTGTVEIAHHLEYNRGPRRWEADVWRIRQLDVSREEMARVERLHQHAGTCYFQSDEADDPVEVLFGPEFLLPTRRRDEAGDQWIYSLAYEIRAVHARSS